MARSPRKALVCFDLGGVLVRIRRTWQSCAEAAGVRIEAPDDPPWDLTDFPLFDAYQIGAVGTVEYLEALATYLGVSPAEAREVHRFILHEPYAGTDGLVRSLQDAGLDTACLSNTNELHWVEMTETGRFPCVEALRYRVTSQGVGLLKPDPAIFRLFDRETGYSAERVVYFDDHQINVDAARAHGWTAFLVDHQGDTAGQIRSHLDALQLIA